MSGRLRIASLVVAISVLAAACGGGSGIGGASAAAVQTPALPDYPAQRFMSDYILASGLRRRQVEALDACMREAGFENDQAAYDEELTRSQSDVLNGDPAVIGYGVSTRYGSPGDWMLEDTGLFPASRREYWEGLSSSERVRYLDTYLGTVDDPGCISQVSPGDDLDSEEGQAIGELHTAWGNAFMKVNSDPDVAAAREEWSRCLAGRGFEYATPLYAFRDLTARLSGVISGYRNPQASPVEAIPRPEQIPPEAFDSPNPDLEALQDHERQLAVASTECGVRPGRDVAAFESRLAARESELLQERRTGLAPIAEAVGLNLDDYLPPREGPEGP